MTRSNIHHRVQTPDYGKAQGFQWDYAFAFSDQLPKGKTEYNREAHKKNYKKREG